MHVISKAKLVEFWSKYPDAETPLCAWLQLARRQEFLNFAELKAIFGSVDIVGKICVFDIGGNKFRLIAAVHFNREKVFIRAILRHADYDRGKWRNDL